jgi:hypothetical protein
MPLRGGSSKIRFSNESGVGCGAMNNRSDPSTRSVLWTSNPHAIKNGGILLVSCVHEAGDHSGKFRQQNLSRATFPEACFQAAHH